MIYRLFALLLLVGMVTANAEPATQARTNLVEAILTDDATRQAELVRGLVGSNEPLLAQALAAWRQGGIFIYETNGARVPFILDSQNDSASKARAIRIADGEFLKDEKGNVVT